jgi:hypothetical protein
VFWNENNLNSQNVQKSANNLEQNWGTKEHFNKDIMTQISSLKNRRLSTSNWGLVLNLRKSFLHNKEDGDKEEFK